MGNVVSSTLQINLKEDVTKTAPQVAAAIDKMQRETAALQAALAKSGGSDKLQANLAKIGASATHIEGVTKAWTEYAKAEGLAAKSSDWTKAQAADVKKWEANTLSAVRAVRKEEALLARARHDESERDSRSVRDFDRNARDREAILRRETRVVQSEAERRREAIARGGIGHYAAGVVGGALSAHGVVRATEVSIEKGADLQHTRVVMEQAGIDAGTRKRIEEQALQLSTRYANVSQVAIMDLAKEARSVLKDPDEVGPITETLAKAKSVLDGLDKTGSSSSGLGMLVKGAESIGAAQDPARFTKLMDGYVKAIQVMGQTINPEQIYEFDKYLKAAGARVSDRFLMTTGLSLAQEMGGSTAANDYFQAQKDIVGGFQNKHSALKELSRVGLVDRNDIDWVGGRGGHLEAKGIKAGHKGVHGADLASTDLDLWVYKYLLPSLEKKGIKEESKQLDFVQKVFKGTEADIISKLITQRGSFENHALLYGHAAGLGGADLNHKDATAGLSAFTTALGNLEANVTSPVMAAAGKALYSIADGLNYLATKAAEHPVAAATAGSVVATGAMGVSGYLSWLSYKKLTGIFGGGAEAAAGEAGGAAAPSAALASRAGLAVDRLGMLGMLLAWQAQADKLNMTPEQLAAAKKEIEAHPEKYGATRALAGKRAGGGPVAGGRAYLVGENGPEIFTPGASGGIATNRQMLAALERDGDSKTAVEIRWMGHELVEATDRVARAVAELKDGTSWNAVTGGGEGGDGAGAGGGHFGGRRGFMGRMGAPSGGGGRPFAGNPGVGHWWTKDRIAHAVDRLVNEAHLSRAGAEGLVSRWATVEAAGGPTAVNPKSGAWGIGQWLGARGGGRTTDFDAQIGKAVGELNGSEARAAKQLRAATNAHEAAIGASMFVRAEHYNPHTGADDWTSKSEAGHARIKGILNGTEQPGGDGPGASSSKAIDVARGLIGANDSAAAQALGHYMHSGAWCADFVNGTLAKIGGRGTNNALAASFFRWGEQVSPDKAKAGDVMVSSHHVGFAEGPAQMHNGRMMVPMISGNHGHRVGESWEPVGKYQIRHGVNGERPPEQVADDPLGLRKRRERRHDEAHPLNASLAPAVDNRHLHETVALLREIRHHSDAINTASARHRGTGGTRVASLNARMRGGFSHAGNGFG